MAKESKIPFPQANDFGKILAIIKVEEEIFISDKQKLMEILSLGTERQISYYLSACEFLDIIDSKRNFTEFGNDLRESSVDGLIIKLCRKIVSLPVFGEVFFYKYLYGESIDNNEISQLIGALYRIENDEVCNRRASTVKNWLKWVEEKRCLD